MTRVHDVDEALGLLRASGERITVARRAVLEELSRAEGRHLPVDELTALVQGRHPDIHLSTVYRTLEFLTNAGVLEHVTSESGASSYHFAGDTHHHAICQSCGQVIELSPSILAPLVRRLERDHSFRADPRHLVISGLCSDCQDE